MGIQSKKVTAGVAPHLQPGEVVRVVLLTRPLAEAKSLRVRTGLLGPTAGWHATKRLAVVGTDENIYLFRILDDVVSLMKVLVVDAEGWQRYPIASAPIATERRSLTLDGVEVAVWNRSQREAADALLRLLGRQPAFGTA